MDVKDQISVTNDTPVERVKICLSCHRKFDLEDIRCPTDRTLLTEPDFEPLTGTPLDEQYQIVGLVGSGGWSVVYKAKQRALGRFVAIKVLHSHLVLDPDKVTRFQREAESASKFNHPAIPAVYDYGLLHGGQPYMIMAFVEGETLAEVLNKSGPLSIEKAIDVFIQCASGLAVAHERGILHRDIKPGNIVLTFEKEEVKILDFGLAKLMGPPDEGQPHATLTQQGHTIGTPAYMSPEQCLGLKLDGRSDLYAFGCVMYEMLTSIRPFEGKDAFEAMSLHMKGNISFEGVTNRGSIPEDLELVVLKTLAKNPVDRYQDANQLAEALTRIKQRAAKSGTTHSGGGSGFLSILKRRLYTRGASMGLNIAQLTITGLVTLTMIGMAWTCISAVVTPHKRVMAEGNVSDLYKESMSKAEGLIDAENYRQAIKYLLASLEHAQHFGAADERLMITLEKLELAYRMEGNLAEAKQIQQQILKVKNTNYGAMYGTTKANAEKIAKLSGTMLNDPNNKPFAEELAATLNDQAALMFTEQRLDTANELISQAIGLEKRVLGEKNQEYARSLSNLAYFKSKRGENREAEKLYKQALSLRETVLGVNHPLVGRSLRNLGDFYWENAQFDQAEQLMQRSMQIFDKLGPSELPNYAWSLNNLGLVYASEKRFDDASKALTEALKIRRQLYGNEGLDVGRTTNNLAQVSTALKQYDVAERQYWSALRVYEKQLGAEHPDTVKCLDNLALMYFNNGNLAEAEPLFKRVMNVLERSPDMDPRLQSAYEHLASIYKHQGRTDAFKSIESRMLKKQETS